MGKGERKEEAGLRNEVRKKRNEKIGSRGVECIARGIRGGDGEVRRKGPGAGLKQRGA